MKRWRFNALLLIAILSTCLVTISANDDEDDDGITIESEKIVIFFISKMFHSRDQNFQTFYLMKKKPI